MRDKKPILITGGEGALASYAKGCVVLGKREADVTDQNIVEKLAQMRPKAIIHLAAITDHTLCEKDPHGAYMVNAIGAYHVALAARAAGAKMVYVSTNAVFEGIGKKAFEVSDIPNPKSAYGHSKFAGECLVRGILPEALIVRTSWIFGGGPTKDKKFVSKIMQQLQQSTSEIKAVSDVRGTPTYGKDLMEILLKLLAEGRKGVVHVTNAGIASRYDMANVITKTIKSSIPVVATPAAAFGPTIVRNEALAADFVIRSWEEALREYIKTEWMKK